MARGPTLLRSCCKPARAKMTARSGSVFTVTKKNGNAPERNSYPAQASRTGEAVGRHIDATAP